MQKDFVVLAKNPGRKQEGGGGEKQPQWPEYLRVLPKVILFEMCFSIRYLDVRLKFLTILMLIVVLIR